MERRVKKGYTLRKLEDNLKGMENHITMGSDVGDEPFPFTEENYRSNEQYHYAAVESNRPL